MYEDQILLEGEDTNGLGPDSSCVVGTTGRAHIAAWMFFNFQWEGVAATVNCRGDPS